jgi:hypothetical protein
MTFVPDTDSVSPIGRDTVPSTDRITERDSVGVADKITLNMEIPIDTRPMTGVMLSVTVANVTLTPEILSAIDAWTLSEPIFTTEDEILRMEDEGRLTIPYVVFRPEIPIAIIAGIEMVEGKILTPFSVIAAVATSKTLPGMSLMPDRVS